MVLFYIAVTAIVALYVLFTKNNNYWKNRGVPYVKPTFFLGNFGPLLTGKKHFGEIFADLYKKCKGDHPYMGYFKMDTPGVIIKDPELIKAVLLKDFNSFMDNDFQVDSEVDPVWSANIFAQTGELWKKNRTAWGLGMTNSKIKAMFDIMLNKSQVMISHLKRTIKNNPEEDIDGINAVSSYFTDVIVTSIFGLEINSFENSDNPFRYVTKNFLNGNIWDAMSFLAFLFLPWLASLLKLKFVPDRIETKLIEVSKSILKNRREVGYQKNNILDSMLMHKGDVNQINEVDVAGFLFNFLLDGTETSAGVGAYVLYSLAKHPDIQQRLRDEINENLEKNSGNLSYETINDMKYLDMIIQETMRLYPATLTIQRICTKSYVLPPIEGKPVKVPVGMTVLIPTYAIHMDPKYHPDPEKFDPDRFSDDNKAKMTKFTYLPFGEGPRICIGFRLAMAQTKICLIELVRNFNINLSKKTRDPLTIDPAIFIMRPPGGIWVNLKPIE